MAEGLSAALALPGLPPLALVTLLAGTVYGFAGFGSALIFMPVATLFVAPEAAVLLMALFGLSSTVTVLPRAWAEAERRAALTMLSAAILCLPLGTWALARLPHDALRWGISGVVALTLAALMAGWRYRVAPGRAALIAVGAASGAIGGATALTGPIVILFQLAGSAGPAAMRANTIVFLTLLGAALVPGLALRGLVDAATLWLGLLLVPLYMLGTRTGQALFTPARQPLYRRVAYGVIAAAVLVGLPLWH